MADEVLPSTPMFAQQMRTADALLTEAMGAITGLTLAAPGKAVKLCDADPIKGTMFSRLWAIPLATNTPTAIYLFVQKKGSTSISLKDAETMAAQPVAATAGPAETVFSNYSEARPLRLGPGESLWAGLGVNQAGGVIITGEVADFSPPAA